MDIEQENPFAASRADGRSDRRVVFDLAEDAEPDTVFSYDELLEALQIGTDREITMAHVYQAIGAANRTLLTEKKRYLSVVRGVGYRVIRAAEQLGAALVKKDRASNHLKRGAELLRHVRVGELDANQRLMFEGQLMVFEGFSRAMQESERRHNRADELIQGLIARVDRLEAGEQADG